jgi:uncharacterized RDD family membrane protein YckC
MTTAPHAFGAGAVRPAEAIHVTGRRVLATILDGLIFGVAYWLLALAFGDVRTEGEAANWVSGLPVLAEIAYGSLVVGYYVLLEGYLGQTLGKMATGIKVVSEATGKAPGIAAAAIRTVLRLIDGLFSYAVAFITCSPRPSANGWATWPRTPWWSASSAGAQVRRPREEKGCQRWPNSHRCP